MRLYCVGRYEGTRNPNHDDQDRRNGKERIKRNRRAHARCFVFEPRNYRAADDVLEPTPVHECTLHGTRRLIARSMIMTGGRHPEFIGLVSAESYTRKILV